MIYLDEFKINYKNGCKVKICVVKYWNIKIKKFYEWRSNYAKFVVLIFNSITTIIDKTNTN